MKTHYKSLAALSESLWKEKGSKFIGYAQKCSSEAEVKEVLQHFHQLHPQATHICYAYKVGVNKLALRANDDGEPNNSAGAPILGQINSYDLTNVLVAVVRYYGGTKLGVGGLISAYKAAAKEAIELNEIIELELTSNFEVEMNYIIYPNFMKMMKQHDLKLLSQEQTDKVSLHFEVKNSKLDEIKFRMEEMEGLKIIKENRQL